MNIISIRQVFLASALLTVSVAVSESHAEELSLPGSACVQEGSVSSSSMLYNGGRALNTSANAAVFRCPIVRNAPDATSIAATWVSVADSHSSQAVECFVRACNSLGTSCNTGATFASAGTGEQTLSLGSVNGIDNGYAYLTCTVPPVQNGSRSAVASYRWDD